MSVRAIKLGYKHLETDAEFIARLDAERFYVPTWARGASLDDWVWGQYNKQRRVIEVFP